MKSEILIHPEELTHKQIHRMASLGVNILGIHPVGGNDAADSLKQLLCRLEEPSFRALLDDAAEHGLEIEYEMHAASYLLPREMFAEHPAYFRMNEAGERVSDFDFCPSNEEGLALIAARAAELAHKLYRSRHTYYFWMDDGRNHACHCPKCRRFSASEQQLIALNRILQELKKTIPDAKMAHIAYVDRIEVPQQVKPEEGIFLEFAPYEKYMKDPDRQRQEEEQRALPLLLSHFGTQDAKVLEYWLDNSLFSKWTKPPKPFSFDPEVMRRDLVYYESLGFEDATVFACYLGRDYEELHGAPDIEAYLKA